MLSNSKFSAFLAYSSIDGLSVLLRRRVVVASAFSMIGMAVAGGMGTLYLFRGNMTMVLADAVMFTFFFSFLMRVKRAKSLKGIMNFGSIVFGLFALFLYFYSGVEMNTFLWFYTYPLISISITGRKTGNLHFLCFFLVLVLGSIIGRNSIFGISSEPILFLRFTLSLFVTFILASYMEQTSEDEHDLLLEQNRSLEKAQKDLQELTIRDSLTGLFNRRYLDEVLPLAISQSRRYKDEIAVLMIDVDHFKKYNDFYGHQQGDEALRKVADILAHSVRRSIDYVCRYGGEEFAIIMNKCSAEAVDRSADNIIKGLENLNEPHVYGVDGRLTVSIGTATADQQGVDTHTSLIERADKALYESKRMGRNRYCKM